MAFVTCKALGTTVALLSLVVLSTLPARAGADVVVDRILMTADELRGAGLTFDGNGLDPWPNECGAAGKNGLAVSSDMLRHFEARGFTLESLCLGLSGETVFDPESGKQLPLARVTDAQFEVVLNLPECYRNGKPLLDCKVRYSHWEPYNYTAEEQAENKARNAKVDKMVRNYIQSNDASGQFSIDALGHGVFDSSYHFFVATPQLSRGYGYALAGGEGDDPESETVDLSTYRKKPSVWSLWFDE